MQSSFQDWSLLVVDDEPDTLQLIHDYMNIIGVKTYLADNGYTAIEMLETLRPTCILMDISMPEINGFDTLAAIRADGSIPYIPVIAVTANVGRMLRSDTRNLLRVCRRPKAPAGAKRRGTSPRLRA